MDLLLPFLVQLLGQAPMLLAYFVGMILALVFWQRCPRPSMLTLFAMVLLLATTVVQSFLVLYFFQMKDDFQWSDKEFSWMLSANGIIGSVLRAMAFGLTLAAVFIGRRGGQQSCQNQEMLPTTPSSRQPEEHGFTNRPSY